MPSIVVRSTRDANGNQYYVARAPGGTYARVACDGGLSQAENERAAVLECIRKCDWHTEAWMWHRSGLPSSTGYEAVYVAPNETYAVGQATMVRMKAVY